MSFHVQTDDIGDENRTATASWDAAKPPAIAWTTAVIVRVTAVAVLMLLILLGNVVVVVTIASRAELRHKHVNVFVLNLAVGDLIFCLLATERIPSTVFDRWIFGPVACKLIPYVQLVTVDHLPADRDECRQISGESYRPRLHDTTCCQTSMTAG